MVVNYKAVKNGSEFATSATAPAGTISIGLRARALRGDQCGSSQTSSVAQYTKENHCHTSTAELNGFLSSGHNISGADNPGVLFNSSCGEEVMKASSKRAELFP